MHSERNNKKIFDKPRTSFIVVKSKDQHNDSVSDIKGNKNSKADISSAQKTETPVTKITTNETQRKKCKFDKTARFIIMLILTFSFFCTEIVVGNLTNSKTLVADSFHTLSSVISLLIGFIGLKISKQSTSRNTFGWIRAEVLGSLINSVFLLTLCLFIIFESISRFLYPEALQNVEMLLIVTGVGVIINLFGILLFTFRDNNIHPVDISKSPTDNDINSVSSFSESSMSSSSSNKSKNSKDFRINIPTTDIKKSSVVSAVDIENSKEKLTKNRLKIRRTKNMNMQGIVLHFFSDAMGSVAVMASGLIVKFVEPQDDLEVTWKMYIDPIFSLFITIFIVISASVFLKEESLVLLQTVPRKFKINELKTLIKNVKGVLDVRHFHIWSLDTQKVIASAHIQINKQEKHELLIMKEIKQIFHKNDIHSTTLQMEYDSHIHDTSYDYCEHEECRKKQCCV